jgi:hypothetical protein
VPTAHLALTLPSGSTVLGWVLFSSISIIAIGYAKLKEEWYPAILGVAIGVYPYFFPSGPRFWSLGIVLTALLFLPRRFRP